MKKGILAIISICICAGIVIFCGKKIHDNSPVEFADENMALVLCEALPGNKTPENVTYKDLEQIKSLHIGYTGYYDTIMDLQYCVNLETLYVNAIFDETTSPSYIINKGKIECSLTEEENLLLQQEMGELLPKLKNLKTLLLGRLGGCTWSSIDFLRDCTQIEMIYLSFIQAEDYSVLKTCSSLKILSLYGSQITEADDLLGFERIEEIEIRNTPLESNPEEVKKLEEAYPDAYITTSY